MKRLVVILGLLGALGASPGGLLGTSFAGGLSGGRSLQEPLVTDHLEIAQEPWGVVRIVDIPREVEPDEEFLLRFSFVMPPGAEVQVGDAIGFELIGPEGLWVGELTVPSPERVENDGFGELLVRRRDFVAELPVRAPAETFEGVEEIRIDGRLRLRGADSSQVYLPVTRRFELPIRIASRPEAPRVVDEYADEPPWLVILAIGVAGLGAVLFLLWRR